MIENPKKKGVTELFPFCTLWKMLPWSNRTRRGLEQPEIRVRIPAEAHTYLSLRNPLLLHQRLETFYNVAKKKFNSLNSGLLVRN